MQKILSKIIQKRIIQLSFQNTQAFGLKSQFFDFIYRDNKSDPHYQATTSCPKQPLNGHTGKTRDFQPRNLEVSRLDNGVHVITEQVAFPTTVDFGILLDVGTRDECSQTSGSLLSIKNTYLKTIINTNETINYGIVQMSGGSFDMDYDQESAYFKANCLSHDVVDVFNMVSDCALEPRSFLAAEVGISKNDDSHKLDNFLKSGESFNEAVFQTAFGLKGLGMPLKGLKGNVSNLTSSTLQRFQLENIAPEKIYVCGAGIQSHQEFLDLVGDKLSFMPASPKTSKREASQYVGGEVRNLTEDNTLSLALMFQGASWNHKDMLALQVASVLLNKTLLPRLRATHHYVDTVEAYNFNYSDSGLFGVKLKGDASNGVNLLNHGVEELKSLASQVKKDDLERAKNYLKNNIFLALERQQDRLEENVKNYKTFGNFGVEAYTQSIDMVTADQVTGAVQNLLSGEPTFISEGGYVNKLPSFDVLRNQLK